MKSILIVFSVVVLVLLSAGCAVNSPTQTNQPVQQAFDINKFISENPGYADCSAPVFCKDLVYIDCHSEVDGPAYYLDKTTGERISECGGACMKPSGEQLNVCQTMCPPKEWTCE